MVLIYSTEKGGGRKIKNLTKASHLKINPRVQTHRNIEASGTSKYVSVLFIIVGKQGLDLERPRRRN